MRRVIARLPLLVGVVSFAQQSAPDRMGASQAGGSTPGRPARFTQAESKADGLARQAGEAHTRGEFGRAVKLWRKAIALESRRKELRLKLALSLAGAGDDDGAREALEQAARLPGPNPPELFVLLGNLEDGRGRHAEAIGYFLRGLREHPEYHNLHFNLGVTLQATDRFAEARASFQRALKFKPDHPGSHFGLAHAYAKEGYFIPALMAIGRFLELEPEGPRSREGLGLARRLLEQGVMAPEQAGGPPTLVRYSGAARDEGNQDEAYDAVRLQAFRSRQRAGNDIPLPVLVFTALSMLGDEKLSPPLDAGFAGSYYLPYYRALHGCACWDGLVFDRLAGGWESGDAAVSDKIDRYRKMSAGFRWNRSPAIPGQPRPASSPGK